MDILALDTHKPQVFLSVPALMLLQRSWAYLKHTDADWLRAVPNRLDR